MAYNMALAQRLRERLAILTSIKEKEMFGGLVFMYRDKMLCGIIKDELMCRIDPAIREELLEQNGVSEMSMKQTVMRGFVLVSQEAIKNKKELDHWVSLCVEFNPNAKAAKKK